ncbi:hypothetical protein [Nocardia asiatica]|uniref:hypothetical protein n=1 Tax=Nocardia asiatica TaxID=209252 RepID=UPI002456CBEA|nr:hypothetical protein [Nocardia asiatica]
MPDQTTGRPTDEELRQIAEDPWVSYAPDIPRRIAIELRELRARLAELEGLHTEVSERADYEGVYRAIRSGIEHILDYRDEWRKLSRAELIEKLMTIHRAGLNPRISHAVVGLAAAVGRDILHERDRLGTRVAELEERSEKRRVQLAAADEDLQQVRGALSPNGRPRRIPAEVDIRRSVVPAVEWLLARVDELDADRDRLIAELRAAKEARP